MKTNKIITSIASALTVSMIVSGCDYSVDDGNNTLQGTTTIEVQEKNDPGTQTDKGVPNQEQPVVQEQQPKEDQQGETPPPPTSKVKEIEAKVSSGNDDAEENTEGEVNLRSTDLEMVVDRGMPQSVGIRFAHVFIPQGAKITKASIVFTTDERSTDATDLKIQIEDSSNAKIFSNRLYNITSRDLVDTDVSWQPEAWEVAGESGPAQTTPDLSALVQQIVDKDEWYNGNAMAFVISGEGSRVAQSFNGSQKGAPILRISYVTDGETDEKNHNTNNEPKNGSDQEENVPEYQEPGFPQDQGTNVDKEVPQGGFEGENGTDEERQNPDTNYGDRGTEDKNNGNQGEEIQPDNGVDTGNQPDSGDQDEEEGQPDNGDNEEQPDNGSDNGNDNTPDNGNDNGTDTEATPDDPAEPLVNYPRISWDLDPAHRAIIGFTPKKRGSYSVHYGYSTDESTWESKAVTSKETFDRSMKNEFVKLTGLQADKDVYFRICNDTQCGERMWFKTAPTEKKDFVFVAGGDTRSGWDIRRAANKMISKIRPLFVMHGGDHTNGNEAKEMKQWLKDWTLAYSHDTIDGKAYTRVYPIVPAHGNHEDGNLYTLCEVYGIDPNDDGVCDEKDTYGAFNVGKQLRVYTLNSQFKYSSRSSYARPMNDWLRSDLANEGAQTQWRVVQYHKPMFPHYTGKHTNPTLHEWWAQLFYDRSVNLVVESDTHIAKATTTVKPDGDGFVATNSGGTLYVGEGSWGAPARSANKPYDWTLGLASIQQVKVITVTSNSMDVRTAEFDGKVNALSREDRMQNSTKLPTGIKWWSIKNKGTVLKLTQTREKRSLLK